MGLLSHMRSVADRNVVMQRIPVKAYAETVWSLKHTHRTEFNDSPLILYANLHTRALTLCCAKRRDSSKCWWTACAARCFSWSWRSCSILSCLSLSIFSLSCLSCLSRSSFSRSWRSRSALSRSFSRSLCCFSSSRASWFCRSLHKNETSIVTGACN